MNEGVKRVRGRYAPSPTGLIHVGNARTALVAWLSARAQGGTFVWRLEDIDTPRVVPGMAEAALTDLSWLGLDWDEGPDRGGPWAPYVQSRRIGYYEEALVRLYRAGRLFPCRLSRKDLAGIASAPHGDTQVAPYPATLRPKHVPEHWFDDFQKPGSAEAAIRFRVGEEPVRFVDRVFGEQVERVDLTIGDFVLRRRDGLYAYQLAVVVDDVLMGITEVVRGVDLLDSTARQIQLIEALGGEVPVYAHVPLVLNEEGIKLSKRDAGLTLRSLREAGVTAEQLVGYLAWTLGLLDRPESCSATQLIPFMKWSRIRRDPIRVPNNLADVLRDPVTFGGMDAAF